MTATLGSFPQSQVDTGTAGVAISGVIAVCRASGDLIMPAQRASGLLLPALGVNVNNVTSGQEVQFVNRGPVTNSASGTFASGFIGTRLYVGSGGLICNLSGFMGGSSSGAPSLSGDLIQRIGVAISGGVYISPDMQLTSGLLALNGFTY